MITALYLRVSTESQVENYSIQEQRDRLNSYCRAMNWTSVKEYTDPGFSGSTLDRPAMQDLIRDAKAGLVERVVIFKLDRLSRSQRDVLALIEDIFLPHNVDIVSMTESLDTATPTGRLMISILSAFAQLERENIKSRMAMGKTARAKAGLFFGGGGHVPTGYDYRGGCLIPNAEADTVRAIFRDYAAGDGINRLSKRFGKAPAVIRYILQNRIYLGEVLHKGKHYPGQHQAIVDKDLFEAVNARYAVQSAKSQKNVRRERAVHPLSGLLYCADCGTKLKLQYGKKFMYYQRLCDCRRGRPGRTIRLDHLEDAVFAEMRKFKVEPIRIKSRQPEDHSAEVKKIDSQISRLVELYAVEGIDMDTIQTKIKKLSGRKAFLLREPDPVPDMEKIVDSLAPVLDSGDSDRIRYLVTVLIARIEIGDTVDIFWNV